MLRLSFQVPFYITGRCAIQVWSIGKGVGGDAQGNNVTLVLVRVYGGPVFTTEC